MDATASTDSRDTGDRSTLLNGLIGALVAIFLSFVPFSTVLGGAVAGYLEGPGLENGLRAGAIAGVIYAAVGGLFLFLAFWVVVGLGFLGAAGPELPLFGGGLLALALVFIVIYALAATIAGGILGALINDEFGDEIGRY